MDERNGAHNSPDGLDATFSIRSPALQKLFEAERGRIVPVLERCVYAPGDVLLDLDRPPEGLFLILSGQVSITRRNRSREHAPIESARRGDVFGGTPDDSGADPERISATAITRVVAMYLSHERLSALRSELPAFGEGVDAFVAIRSAKQRCVTAMRGELPFRHASPRLLSDLIDAAEILSVPAGATVVEQDAPSPGLFFVAAGELHAMRTDASGRATLLAVHHEGNLFGHLSIVTESVELASVVAVAPSKLVRVPEARYRALLQSSAAFRRCVAGAMGGPGAAIGLSARATRRSEVLAILTDTRDAPVAILTDLLARTVAEDHGDDALVIDLVRETEGDRASQPRVPDPVRHYARMRLVTPDSDEAVDLVGRVVEAAAPVYEQVFLQAEGRDPSLIERLAAVLTKVIFVSNDPLAMSLPEAMSSVPVVPTMLLGGSRRPQQAQVFPPSTVRLTLDLKAIARMTSPADRAIEALTRRDPRLRATLSRWGRSATERLVGVALGGGGAWGFAHVTLLRRLAEAQIPVDLVSGASFGSLAGAFYCAEGLAGLDKLMTLGKKANGATRWSLLSSSALATFVDRNLGGARLEDLEIPLFPVSTDIGSGTEHVVRTGTLGDGVRTSSAFPALFTPVIRGGVRYVDGGFINNVPASVLVAEGADLVIASNIVAAPPKQPPSRPLLPGPIGRFFQELDPIKRTIDFVRSGFVLMHTNGDRESYLADVTFESEPLLVSPFDFTNGPEIAAHAERRVHKTVEQVRARWERLSPGPRGDA